MTLTQIYLRAAQTWPGLADAPIASMTDAQMRDRIAAIRRGLERDVSDEVAQVWRETGAERASTRRWLLINLPKLREARLIDRAAFALLVAERRRQRAIKEAA